MTRSGKSLLMKLAYFCNAGWLFLVSVIGAPGVGYASPQATLFADSDPRLQQLLKQVEGILPSEIKDVLLQSRRPIRVVINSKLPAPERVEQLCSREKPRKKVVLGRVHTFFPDRIELNSWLLEQIQANPDHQTPCTHDTIRKLAQATLIHELAHLYDGRHRVSDDVGFQQRVWTGGTPARTPDAYELKNAAENFAVNLELFLLDSEYKCRRPTLYSYLSGVLGASPFDGIQCRGETAVLLHSQTIGKNLMRPADLNPDRIYQIHFLFASQGPALMSRWGHAMYRLVVCAPERTEIGPDCLRDIKHHVVVSHRAAVSDLSISYWKGILGKYPSQLFLYALPEVVDEYTKLELRDMLSLPLKVSDTEKKQIVHRVLEQYWGYRGRYYFFTNNCADEALKLLQGAIDDSALDDLRTLTPLGLYEKYIDARIIDPSHVQDRERGEKEGLFFRSKAPAYDTALRSLKTADSKLEFERIQDFAEGTQALGRREMYDRMKASTAEKAALKGASLPGSFYVLETYALMELQRALSQAVADGLEKLEKKRDPRAQRFKRAFVSGLTTGKAALPSNGYGIPLSTDYTVVDSSPDPEQFAAAQALAKEINDWVRMSFGEKLDEIGRVGANIKFFRDEILKTK